jgi:hypothetical protein
LASESAVLYCPGKLDLSGIEPTEELTGVLAEPTQTNLLVAAEHCVTAALRIWTELNGRRTTPASSCSRSASRAR